MSNLIAKEPCVVVSLVNDVADFAVWIDAADHPPLTVDGVGQLLLLKRNKHFQEFKTNYYNSEGHTLHL